jgi:hypothetical protein
MASSDTSALTRITVKLKGLEDPDPLLREIATSMLAIVKERIHEKGLNSAGGQIGTYSDSYLEYRAKVGKSTGSNVILALTGQMENDFKIVAQSKTRYALGFSNKFNAEKADWLENGRKAGTVKEHTRNVNGKTVKVSSHQRAGTEGYGDIYKLTTEEKELVQDIIDEYIANLVQ